MKNIKRTTGANLKMALPVALTTAVAGQLVVLGAGGLKAILHSARATTETVADGTAAPGLKAGEATVELIGVHTTMTIALGTAINQYAPVYVDGDGAYTATASTNTKVGVSLTTIAGAGNIELAPLP